MNLLYANDKLGAYPQSYWASVVDPLPPFPCLEGEVTADVCVIGAGFTGLSAALHLAESGFSVVVLEAQRVGFGASGRNGGQVGSGHNIEQEGLERKIGLEDARVLWDLAEASKACVHDLISKHSIACDWRDGIIYGELRPRNLHHSFEAVEKLNRDYGYSDIRALTKAEIADEVGSNVYCGGTIDMGSGHLNPQKYVLGLARAAQKAGVQIYETSCAEDLAEGEPARISTESGIVTASHVVLAGNGYLGGLSPKVARRVMPINNFIIATEPLGEDMAQSLIANDVAVHDSKFVVNYYRRSADHRMVFGGGESYGYRFPRDIVSKVRKPMLEVYPQLKDAKIDYAWGGTLAITTNRMPSFQRVTHNIISASGYSGHGVALACLAGQIMAETISGDAARFEQFALTQPMRFPGGPWLRSPLLTLAMGWYALRDRL